VSGALDLHGQNWTAELKYVSGGNLEIDYISLTATASVEESTWGAIKSLYHTDQD